ncbi:MAG: lipid-A-disaccharide synthase [Candidatus Margulisbacteria bacterium]|nr:lipid-A-disaccharide synthase [Candidatus Margulisiibacteriota bacterium]
MNAIRTIMISAGEVSGDVHGTAIVRELKKLDSNLRFIGMGSHRMAAEGVRLYADISSINSVGALEPIQHLPRFLKTLRMMKRAMEEEKPDLFLPIDSQGFHKPLMKLAKRLGIPTVYYIAPQEWLWGTKKKGEEVLRMCSKVLCIFEKEYQFYNQLGDNAVYIGHPTVDLATSSMSKKDFYKRFKIDAKNNILAIFPGSRAQEIKHTYPVLIKAAKKLQQKLKGLQLVISISSPWFEGEVIRRAESEGMENVIFYKENPYDLIANSMLSFVSSGTITLEHAVLGTPCIACYRFPALSYWVIRQVIEKKFKKIKYIAMPNIIAGKMIMPEFLQDNATPENIVHEAIPLITDPEYQKKMKTEIMAIQSQLGKAGVIKRAASEIFDTL